MSISNLWKMPWSTLMGVCIGVAAVMSLPEIAGPLRGWYDDQFPVLRMSGKIVDRRGDAVILEITGEKLRGEECRLVSVYGYTVDGAGMKDTRAIVERVDRQATGQVRDDGYYNIGLWSVRPVGPDVKRVQVYTHHDCFGRAVLSVIADVAV